MATLVKSTPTLKGNDAKNFVEELLKVISALNTPDKAKEKAKEVEFKRMAESYKVVHSISNGAF